MVIFILNIFNNQTNFGIVLNKKRHFSRILPLKKIINFKNNREKCVQHVEEKLQKALPYNTMF